MFFFGRTTQTYHGGQDWRGLDNFMEDFSVTTNGLGTPVGALEAARKAVSGSCVCECNVCVSGRGIWLVCPSWEGRVCDF